MSPFLVKIFGWSQVAPVMFAMVAENLHSLSAVIPRAKMTH
jgi:hypothetical protein